MTTARTKDGTVCAQHHVPRQHCPPQSKHPRSARHRDDDWAAMEDVARARNSDASTLITLAAQVAAGYVRCWKCPEQAPPVPLRYGDLAGAGVAEWMADAEKRAAGQHPDHQPVWLGIEPAPVDERDIDATLERLRTQVGQVRAGNGTVARKGRPAPASAVFMEPKGERA